MFKEFQNCKKPSKKRGEIVRKAYDSDLQDNRLWMSQAFFNDEDTANKKQMLREEGLSTRKERKARALKRDAEEEARILEQGLRDFKLENDLKK